MASGIEELAKRDTWRLIWRLLFENAADKWKSFALGFALLVIVSATTAATAYIMEDVINEIFVDRRRDAIFGVALAVALIFVLKGVAAYGNAVIMARVGNAITARLQSRMFGAMLRQDLAFFERHQLSDLVVRFQNSVNGARNAIETLVVSIGRDVLSLVGLVAVMVIQDPTMSLIALCIGPPAVIGVGYLMRKVKGVAKQEFTSLGQVMGHLKETVLGIKVVKTYRLENRLSGDFERSVNEVEALKNGLAKINALTVPMMEALGGLAIAAAIIYGGLQAVDGTAEPGAFFSFITALLLAYEPARRLARFNVQFQQSMVGVTLVYEILDLVEAPSEHNDGAALAVGQGAIAFDGVTFSYSGDDEGADAALQDLTIDFVPNGVTALVGPSGGGKSTVFALITRLRRPRAGRITIDGVDIAGVSVGSLRAAVTYVTQEAFLFDLSIRENIRLGRPDASDAEIEAAARAAHAHDFILEQPEGYDTRVGEGGGKLSGGQRQRIAIARAMLANTPIILLDEATSALDTASEKKVQQALDELMRGRTTIVIAHRLSTIRSAERIHVIEKGRCVESGAHEALIEAGGLYAHLHESQFGQGGAGQGADG